MAPRSKPWFRFYVETVHDPKVRRLKPEHRWLWVAVLACARASAVSGELLVSDTDPMDLDDLADVAGMPKAVVKRGLDALAVAGMIDREGSVAGAWRVVKWAERQFESDVSSERVAALRKRRCNGDVTAETALMQRSPSETETEAETDTEGGVGTNSLTRSRELIGRALEHFRQRMGTRYDPDDVQRAVDEVSNRGYDDADITAALDRCTWPSELRKALPPKPDPDQPRPTIPETPRCPSCDMLSPDLANFGECLGCGYSTKTQEANA